MIWPKWRKIYFFGLKQAWFFEHFSQGILADGQFPLSTPDLDKLILKFLDHLIPRIHRSFLNDSFDCLERRYGSSSSHMYLVNTQMLLIILNCKVKKNLIKSIHSYFYLHQVKCIMFFLIITFFCFAVNCFLSWAISHSCICAWYFQLSIWRLSCVFAGCTSFYILPIFMLFPYLAYPLRSILTPSLNLLSYLLLVFAVNSRLILFSHIRT
jgi:hypothetical protein